MPIQIDLGHGAGDKTPTRTGAVVGIDLGTTNSLVAYQGKVLKEGGDDGMLPSVLLVNEAGKVELVGKAARAERARRAGNVLYSIKRLMGRSLADLHKVRDSLPFELSEEAESPQVRVRVSKRNFSPIELSAEILKALKARAERVLGREVDRAVITVPAYFDDAQRQATKAAGKVAGLEVLRVMNEPTAAALAYGWTEGRNGVVAVYDLGGGTFDLSLLRLHDNVFEVLSTAGDTQLGGDDFDQAVAELAARHLELQPPSSEADRQSWWGALLFEAERVKRALGQMSEVDFNVELTGKKYSTRIKLSDLESAWGALVDRTLQCCQRALRDAGLQASDLSDVLLVGGTTRMPVVRQQVSAFFGREANTSLNPDEAVALGAALQADVLAGNASDRLLLDVIPLSLGIETMGGVVSKLISRNSTIPVEARENYTNHADGQTAFDIHVLQGERELVRDCRSLARFKLRGLAPAPAGYHRIEVLFRIDANGILNVRATDLRTQKMHEIEVRPSFGISDDELFRMLESSYDNAESDMQARQIAEARVEAQTVVTATEKAIKNAGHLLEPLQRSEVSARLVDLKNAASGSDPQAITQAISALDEVGKELAELQVNAALEALRNKRPDQV